MIKKCALSIFVFFAAIGVGFSQKPETYRRIEERFRRSVKQTAEFVARFNGEETSDSKNISALEDSIKTALKTDSLTPDKKAFLENKLDSLAMLKKYGFMTLFKQNGDSVYIQQCKDFIAYYKNNPFKIKEGEGLTAKVYVEALLGGVPKKIVFEMAMRVKNGKFVSWRITGAQAPFLQFEPKEKAEAELSGVIHDLHFASLPASLNDKAQHSASILEYEAGRAPSAIWLTGYLLNLGVLKIKKIEDYSLFFNTEKKYIIKIKRFANSSGNTGWLIDDLKLKNP